MERGLNKNEALQQLSLLYFLICYYVCVPPGECVGVYVCVTLIQNFLKILKMQAFFFMLLELEARERGVLTGTHETPRWSFWTRASSREPSSY